jgi:NAD(P)-dependent dehydrogenase (short-subunit alcohol dehydrogenase family)
MDLKDKVVVITGGAGGLGKAIGIELTKAQAKVVIADIDQSAEFVVDVRKESDIESLMQKVLQKYERIDIWINNAGIQIPPAPVEEIDIAKSRNLFEINLFGTMLGSKHALIQMKKQGSGAILNMVSTAALGGKALLSSYAASKYAIDGFTKSLRAELAGSAVKVFSVFPGGTQTELYKDFVPADFDKYMKAEDVAAKIVANLQKDQPEEELVIKRP